MKKNKTKWFFAIIILFNAIILKSQKDISVIAFWNVENLYDTINDAKIDDEEWLPTSKNKWNTERYSKKLYNTSLILSKIGTDQQKNPRQNPGAGRRAWLPPQCPCAQFAHPEDRGNRRSHPAGPRKGPAYFGSLFHHHARPARRPVDRKRLRPAVVARNPDRRKLARTFCRLRTCRWSDCHRSVRPS